MGMQHDRPTTSDALRIPASSAAATMAIAPGLAKYWVLTNLFPGPIPQVCILNNFSTQNRAFIQFRFFSQVSTVYTIPTSTSTRIEDGKNTISTTQPCLTTIPATESLTLIGEHRAISSSASQHQSQVRIRPA